MMKLVLLLVVCLCAAEGLVNQPKIVFVFIDDLGWNDVGFHGSEIMVSLQQNYLCAVADTIKKYQFWEDIQAECVISLTSFVLLSILCVCR